jgi:hypothetical protein
MQPIEKNNIKLPCAPDLAKKPIRSHFMKFHSILREVRSIELKSRIDSYLSFELKPVKGCAAVNPDFQIISGVDMPSYVPDASDRVAFTARRRGQPTAVFHSRHLSLRLPLTSTCKTCIQQEIGADPHQCGRIVTIVHGRTQ